MTTASVRTEPHIAHAPMVSRLIAAATITALISVIFLAPADAASPASAPRGLAISGQADTDPSSLGDDHLVQVHGIAWAAREPIRAVAVLGSLNVPIIGVEPDPPTSCCPPSDVEAALDPPATAAVDRGPPLTSFARAR